MSLSPATPRASTSIASRTNWNHRPGSPSALGNHSCGAADDQSGHRDAAPFGSFRCRVEPGAVEPRKEILDRRLSERWKPRQLHGDIGKRFTVLPTRPQVL